MTDTPTPASIKPTLSRFGRCVRWLLGVESTRATGPSLAILCAGLLVALASFAISFHDARQYGGVDLRAKVVAARRFLAHQDPYFPSTDPGNELLLDPYRPAADFTGTTYPPTVLAIYSTMARLPYKQQRLAWFGIEWALLAAASLVLSRATKIQHRFAYWLVVFFVICPGHPWRLHVERGQYYVQVLFWASVGCLCLIRRSWNIAAGIAFGLMIAIRPATATLLIPLAIGGRWKAAVSAVVTAGIAVGLTIPFCGIGLWKSYEKMVTLFERESLVPGIHLKEHPPYTAPSMTAEGVDFSDMLPGVRSTAFNDIALDKIDHRLLHREPGLDQGWIALTGLGLVLAVSAAAAWFGRRRPVEWIVLLAMATMLSTDFFLPLRFGYADINLLLLLPVSLIVLLCPRGASAWSRLIPRALLCFFIVGMTLGRDVVEIGGARAEPVYIITWLVTAVAVLVFGSAEKFGETRIVAAA